MKRGDTYGCEPDGRIHCAAKKKPGTDAGAVGGAGTRFREDGLKMGERSFQNKRILRNNLCLPACRILVYMRITLEI